MKETQTLCVCDLSYFKAVEVGFSFIYSFSFLRDMKAAWAAVIGLINVNPDLQTPYTKLSQLWLFDRFPVWSSNTDLYS